MADGPRIKPLDFACNPDHVRVRVGLSYDYG